MTSLRFRKALTNEIGSPDIHNSENINKHVFSPARQLHKKRHDSFEILSVACLRRSPFKHWRRLPPWLFSSLRAVSDITSSAQGRRSAEQCLSTKDSRSTCRTRPSFDSTAGNLPFQPWGNSCSKSSVRRTRRTQRWRSSPTQLSNSSATETVIVSGPYVEAPLTCLGAVMYNVFVFFRNRLEI